MSTEKVRVRVNPNCYIRYPHGEGGQLYGGNWEAETRPDGTTHRVWKGQEFDCERSFAYDVNESEVNHRVPPTAEAKPRPILSIIALIEDSLPVIKSTKPAKSEIEIQETETISIKSKPGPKPKIKQAS